jgi:type II secretory pathway component GspD/PulD (secretin)
LAVLLIFLAVPAGIAETPQSPAAPPVFPSPKFPQPQSPKGFEAGMEKTIFLDLRDINVIDVFKFIAVQGNLNIVTSKNVQGRSTLLLRDVKIKDALDILAISNQLAYEVRNKILYIMTEDEYSQTHGKNFNDKKRITIRTLRTAKPSYAMAALQGVQSSIGKVIIDEDTGTVVMIDTPEKLMEMNGILDKVELNLKTRTIKLQFAKADDVAAQLKPQIEGKGVGTVIADARSNQIFLSAYPDRLDEAVKMVKALDSKTKAVLIETRILQLTLNPTFNFGIDWEKVFPKQSMNDLTLSGHFPIDSTVTSMGALKVGTMGYDSFVMAVQATKAVTSTKVLANPRLMTLDRQEAKINIGDRIPYVVSTTTATSGTNTGISQDVRFIDVGLMLAVTPTINDDGYVTMKIRPEISSKTGDIDSFVGVIAVPGGTQTINNKIPIVNSTFVESTLIVRDGNSAILGGLISDVTTEDNKGIPYLMDLPYIGNLFKSRNESITRKEVVIIITPHVVNSEADVLDKPIAIKGKSTGNIRDASIHENMLAPPAPLPQEDPMADKAADKVPASPPGNRLSSFLQKISPFKKG